MNHNLFSIIFALWAVGVFPTCFAQGYSDLPIKEKYDNLLNDTVPVDYLENQPKPSKSFEDALSSRYNMVFHSQLTMYKVTKDKTYLDLLSAHGQVDSLTHLDSNKVELKRHTIFFEVGGHSYLYSIKYDCILKQWNKFSINYDIGFSILPAYFYPNMFLPMHLSVLYGKNKGKLEFGVFITPWAWVPSKEERLDDNEETDYGFDKGIDIGYRYQKKKGGLFFKAYFLASYFENGRVEGNSFISYFLPWIGIGIGHTFR